MCRYADSEVLQFCLDPNEEAAQSPPVSCQWIVACCPQNGAWSVEHGGRGRNSGSGGLIPVLRRATHKELKAVIEGLNKGLDVLITLRQPDTIEDPLTAILRSGARRLLAQAIEAEADASLASMKGVQLPDGRDRVVRHGHGPERQVQSGIGAVPMQRVWLRDRGADEGFCCSCLRCSGQFWEGGNRPLCRSLWFALLDWSSHRS